MDCVTYRPQIEPFALGMLLPDESSSLRHHMERCGACREYFLEVWVENAEVLRSLKSPVHVPYRVWSAFSGPLPQPMSPAIAAGVVFTALASGWLANEWRSHAQSQSLKNELKLALAMQQTHLQLLRTVSAPKTRRAVLTRTDSGAEAGTVWLTADQRAALVAINLPPLPEGRTYQMWILPNEGNPKPAGLFHPLPDGSAFQIAAIGADAAGVAVSREPMKGSRLPTTTPLLVAKW